MALESSNTKRIAKNTIMLYIRMVVIMLVSLYTSRVVLDVLGVEDFGIYNIVGGVVVSLTFISNALSSSLQRFLSYEIGLCEKGNPSKVFSMGINIMVLFNVFAIIFFETIGLWFLNNVLNIPSGRILEANIAYQLSILTFCVSLLRIPYDTTIISHEKMSIYAYMTIVDALLRLLIVFLLVCFPDKLVAYSILVFVVSLCIFLCYRLLCLRLLGNDCKYRYEMDKTLLKTMTSFSGWNLVGGGIGVVINEGSNYMMNIFLGVRVNAAVGIAKQVGAAVNSFTSNFQVAFNPQIVKIYASNKKKELFQLIFRTSSLSYYLMMIFVLPLIFFSDAVFHIWLVEVPEYTIIFSVLIMLTQMVAAIGSPLWMTAHATGDIKYYQLSISLMSIISFPIIYLLLKFGYSPYWVFVIFVVTNIFILIYRVFFLKKRIGFPAHAYFKDVIMKSLGITIICGILPFVLSMVRFSYWVDLGYIIISIISSCLIIFYWGITKEERNVVMDKILSVINNLKN